MPTDAGRSYIAAAKRILADVAEAERAVMSLPVEPPYLGCADIV